jgi:hypothetical protein
MRERSWWKTFLFLCFPALFAPIGNAWSQVEVIEVFCRSCGYRGQFMQGADPGDVARNVQHIIVVCERTREIRNIQIPLDPNAPAHGSPLMAGQYGTGKSELLGERLPKFLIPGTTCPLFPLASYLEWNVCPVDGRPGISIAAVAPR